MGPLKMEINVWVVCKEHQMIAAPEAVIVGHQIRVKSCPQCALEEYMKGYTKGLKDGMER